MVNTCGVTNTTFFSGPTAPYVKGNETLVPELSPNPTWKELLAIPAFIGYFVVPANVAKGDLIKSFIVHPRAAFSSTAQIWSPGALAYYAGLHHRYSGGIKIALRIFGPQSQKVTLRLTVLPIGTTSTAITDADSGDANSKVVEVVGDTTILIPVPFLSAYQALPTGDIGGNESEAIGTIVIQAETSIISQNTPNTAFLTGLIYQAAAEDFIFSSYQDPPAQEHIELGIPPPARWAKTRETVHDAKIQASMRDIFGKPFPPFVPCTPKTTTGMINPDQTRGPVELGKRWLLQVENSVLPYVWDYEFLSTGADRTASLFYGFTGWSGSKNVRVIQSQASFQTHGHIVAIKVNSNENVTDSSKYYGGQVICDLSKSTALTFSVPYDQNLVYREIFNGHDLDPATDHYYIRAKGNTGITNVDIFTSVGDDFQVYLFHSPPYISRLPPGAKATPKVAVPEPDSDYDSDTDRFFSERAKAKSSVPSGSGARRV